MVRTSHNQYLGIDSSSSDEEDQPCEIAGSTVRKKNRYVLLNVDSGSDSEQEQRTTTRVVREITRGSTSTNTENELTKMEPVEVEEKEDLVMPPRKAQSKARVIDEANDEEYKQESDDEKVSNDDANDDDKDTNASNDDDIEEENGSTADPGSTRKSRPVFRYFDAPKCHRCGETGHIQAECLMKETSKPCTLCGVVGHREGKCPRQICHKCGRVGHIAKDCSEEFASDDYKEVETRRLVSNSRDLKFVRCMVCSELGHVNCKETNYSKVKLEGKARGGLCPNCSGSHAFEDCKQERFEYFDDKCFRCGRSGHIAAKCPSAAFGRGSSSSSSGYGGGKYDKCFSCGKPGHISAHCPWVLERERLNRRRDARYNRSDDRYSNGSGGRYNGGDYYGGGNGGYRRNRDYDDNRSRGSDGYRGNKRSRSSGSGRDSQNSRRKRGRW